jgi:hypothetical protein
LLIYFWIARQKIGPGTRTRPMAFGHGRQADAGNKIPQRQQT